MREDRVATTLHWPTSTPDCSSFRRPGKPKILLDVLGATKSLRNSLRTRGPNRRKLAHNNPSLDRTRSKSPQNRPRAAKIWPNSSKFGRRRPKFMSGNFVSMSIDCKASLAQMGPNAANLRRSSAGVGKTAASDPMENTPAAPKLERLRSETTAHQGSANRSHVRASQRRGCFQHHVPPQRIQTPM